MAEDEHESGHDAYLPSPHLTRYKELPNPNFSYRTFEQYNHTVELGACLRGSKQSDAACRYISWDELPIPFPFVVPFPPLSVNVLSSLISFLLFALPSSLLSARTPPTRSLARSLAAAKSTQQRDDE